MDFQGRGLVEHRQCFNKASTAPLTLPSPFLLLETGSCGGGGVQDTYVGPAENARSLGLSLYTSFP